MYYADKLYLNGKRISGNLQIPEGITKIPYCAFDGCDGIKSVEIPNSVTGIGMEAFSGCNSLTSITIPESVTKIENDAFKGCSNLTIYGHKDSYAEKFAKEKSIAFEEI